MGTYLIIFAGAAAASLAATFLAIRLAPRIGAIDRPGVRKVHTAPTPRIGGVAVFVAVVGAVGAAALLDDAVGESVRRDPWQIVALLGAATFVLTVGLVDDIRGLAARHKLAAQLAAAGALCAAGVRIESLGAAGWLRIELGWLSWPVTLLWLVGITNSVNLIDGLDGLAAGIAAITCAVLAAVAVHAQHTVMAVLMMAMLGGLAGFLVFNFNPAKVFLGDCGSMFLGFMLAGASVLSSTKAATAVGLALPLLAMGVPIFDTLGSIVRRALERRSPLAPDRRHIHHRLLSTGLRQRHIVLLLHGVTALSAALGMFMMISSQAGALAVFLCVLLLLGLFLRAVGALRLQGAAAGLRRILERRRQTRKNRLAFEAAQLHLRDARSADAWWRAIARAAGAMGADQLTVTCRRGAGPERTVLDHRCAGPPETGKTIRLTIPLADGPDGTALRAVMDMRAADSLEAAGARVALLGRLIDEGIESVDLFSGGADAPLWIGPAEPERRVA